MGTREKLFRQKLADQIEGLLNTSEKVFKTEKLDNDWLESMLRRTKDLTSALTIYQFLHDLPENEKLQVEFLELKEEEEIKKEAPEVPSYGDEILKEIDEFEIKESVEVFEVIENSPPEESAPTPTETIEEEIIVAVEEVVEEVSEIIDTEEEPEEIIPEIVEEVIEETPVETEEVVSVQEDDKKEINDAVANTEPSLADKLSTKSITKLADSIALNERFLYSNELFNGNMEAFKKALSELDHIASLADAKRYLDVQLKEEHNWNMDSEAVQSFISLVERRFN